MAPQRKRENRENIFYDVGVQGRKTGITLADRGVYDEHGLEALSGVFSSPEKSPPKRSGTVTASESMDIQESSIPEFTTAHQILRNPRTHLPPPRSRSPKKTALGSSPRRQSSMAPRGSSVGLSSPIRPANLPIARRLDFEQDESSLQDNSAFNGSGARRAKRNGVSSVYDIPEDEGSPLPEEGDMLEESMVQEEIAANENSEVMEVMEEESFAAHVGDDATTGVEVTENLIEDLIVTEEAEEAPEPVQQPSKRGRKRKSDALEPTEQANDSASLQKRGAASAQASDVQKKGKKGASATAPQPRRSQRVSDMSELEPSVTEAPADISMEAAEQTNEPAPVVKRRGRPPRAQPAFEKQPDGQGAASKTSAAKQKSEDGFKKPTKPTQKPKATEEPKKKVGAQKKDKTTQEQAKEKTAQNNDGTGKLVNAWGNPLSKKDVEQMSTASAGSRYGRGRHLSVFRELDPQAVARVGRTGRHRVAPIDFWKNESINYDVDGSMTAIVKNQDPEPERKRSSYRTGTKAKKRTLTSVEEEEVELEPWEREDGVLFGNYKDYDPITELTKPNVEEGIIAWSEKGIDPIEVADGSFKYRKMDSAGYFFNWGMLELAADQMKRTKNSRMMHMLFNVQYGTVEVKVHVNEFVVHKGGIWQVPRGNTYSIRNVGSGTARIFFAQAREAEVQDDEDEGQAAGRT
ncbi:similar to cupin domain containing protein [Plenodomus lingam JN3]|uniref:CENP-C homolog n=1 Tax=Leptosphaeria maculans (strain JN3 / isolate v23.1.3 / race Av1-4-5-6-7-8) TaxID=985895 RepID=E5A086_LEPMJ|nr:similar to cupin domain containing protein [Plenodomus lingam JN3]CBX96946.1 similar to cupin domain containing protein [Plenodomus lingam JN3]